MEATHETELRVIADSYSNVRAVIRNLVGNGYGCNHDDVRLCQARNGRCRCTSGVLQLVIGPSDSFREAVEARPTALDPSDQV